MSRAADEAMAEAKTKLDRVTVEWQSLVEREMSTQLRRLHKHKVSIVLRLSNVDRLRLLNLRVWRDRYKVSLSFILWTLLSYWSKASFIKRKRASDGPGVRIATLVGKKSKAILVNTINEQHPEHEHLTTAVSEAEVAAIYQSGDYHSAFNVHDPMNLIRAYKIRLRELRKDADVVRGSLSRRAYRDNPFRT